MIFKDLTAEVTLRTLLSYEQEQAKMSADELKLAHDVYGNTIQPDLPPEMEPPLRAEYTVDWTPAPIGKMIVSRITSAMLARDVDRATGNDLTEPCYAAAMEQFPRRESMWVKTASTYGYSVVRIRPDFRRGLTYGLWRPTAPGGGDGAIPIIDTDDPQGEPVGMIFRYSYLTPGEQSDMARGHFRAEHTVVECITRHQRDPYNGDIIQPGIRVKYVDDKRVPYYDGDAGLNPLGDYLGAVMWRNCDSMDHALGESDVLPLMALLRRVNHVITDGHLLLKWNVWPLTYVIGGRSKNDLPYHWRAIWEIVGDGGSTPSVGKMEFNPAGMGAVLDYVKYLMSLISMTSSVPAFSLGDLEGIGNLSSGRAYEIAMTPLADMVQMRTPTLIDNEYSIMREIVAMSAYRTSQIQGPMPEEITGLQKFMRKVQGLPAMPDYQAIEDALKDATIEYGGVDMARSAMDAAQVHATRIGSGYESTEEAIRDTHPQWNDEQVADELERIGGLQSGGDSALDTVAQQRVQAMRDRIAADAVQS